MFNFLALIIVTVHVAVANADDGGMSSMDMGTIRRPSLMNPDISLDGLFTMSQFNRADPITFNEGHDPHQNGFNFQQVELAVTSPVDPYMKADAFLVLTPGKIEVEEAFLTTTSLPASFQLKAGQFFTDFGRNNPTHPHSWDFVDKPLVLGRFFGGDGLRNPGAEVSWLTPLPWYSEFIASLQNSTGETSVSFLPQSQPPMRGIGDSLWMGRWNNYVVFSDDSGLNIGASYLTGPNQTDINLNTKVIGTDLFFKYRDPGSLSFIAVQVEAMKRIYNTPGQSFEDWGWYGQIVYRLGGAWQRWFIGTRFDQVGPKPTPVFTSFSGTLANPTDLDTSKRWRLSPVITFFPTEFSKVRFQYDYDQPESLSPAQQVVSVQFEFLVGAHGAHKF